MSEKLDLAISAIKNENFDYYLLTFEKAETSESDKLLSLITKWNTYIRKSIPESSASFFINNGNLVLIINKNDFVDFEAEANGFAEKHSDVTTLFTKLKDEELLKFSALV